MELTESKIKKLPKGRHSDDQSGVQFDNRTSTPKWIMRHRSNGQNHQIVLGTYPEMTLAEARLAAVTASSSPTDSITVARFVDEYLTPRSISKQKDTGVKYYWQHIVEQIGNVPLNRVGLKEIDKCMISTTSKSGPKQIHKQLSAGINKAIEWGCLDINHVNPAKYRKVAPLPPRKTHVKADQIGELIRAIDTIENPYIKGAIKMTLLSGARANEILRLKWSDITETHIVFRTTKNTDVHSIPIFKTMREQLDILAELKQNEWLFPSHRSHGHLKSYRADWDRVRNGINFPDLTRHDLRRTVSIVLINQGVPLETVSNVLNHRTSATTRAHYAAYTPETKAAALAHIDTIFQPTHDTVGLVQQSN
jgi:integrase